MNDELVMTTVLMVWHGESGIVVSTRTRHDGFLSGPFDEKHMYKEDQERS